MTWRPTTCQILEHKLLDQDNDTAKPKWEMIQIHNKEGQTKEEKSNRAIPYITLLRNKYEK